MLFTSPALAQAHVYTASAKCLDSLPVTLTQQCCPLPICPCILLLALLCCFGSYCVSLQEVAQRWPSRDSASAGNDWEDRQGSSEEGQSYPCHVRVSELNFINYATLAIMQ